jgi:pyridoxal 5'-phosphate synthase pdxT subunit
MKIGVLALQGGFALHARALTQLGLEAVEVRDAAQLEQVDGLVLPGGESTTQLRLITRHALRPALERFATAGKPILATCAGLILIAKKVVDPEQDSLGLLEVSVARNAWGRQLDSFEGNADGSALPLVFIRAPRILDRGGSVEVLATLDGEPVWVRQGNITGATFHPELTASLQVHREAFAEQGAERVAPVAPAS